MKALKFDSLGGASGDMILASLVGLGASIDALKTLVASMQIEPFDVRTETVSDRGMSGLRVTVDTPDPSGLHHRGLTDIIGLIEKSQLSPAARSLSVAVFTRLAEAEARVHGTTPDQVHFHEVGAVDSIVDVVASCAALEMLGVTEVDVGPLPLGQGTVRGAHGLLPVPVPATVELLKGSLVTQTDEPFELVTPTAAALLTTWRETLPPSKSGRWTLSGSANAIGHRELQDRPNLLRATLIKKTAADGDAQDCLVLECNVDDTVPELLGSLTQALLDKGALDVFTASVQMKKQRPGSLVTVLCMSPEREALLDTIFLESTTFGVREYSVSRTLLERRHESVDTPYGTVRVKIGSWKGRDITRAPEHDDCAARAREHDVPVRTVYEAACRMA
ncbi:MAG: nickel pincer cofactor biosynthesis protein LarC [Lentisphaerae bacterium]|nr:nickel pincer cofactor biosynthesis protein LarC [Lentisphaerota bacterium]